jgi:hypothetical protein
MKALIIYLLKKKTMKKQQNASLAGKKLSRTEMKNLTGGTSNALGIWVCVPDGYACYSNKSTCNANCTRSCVYYGGCP